MAYLNQSAQVSSHKKWLLAPLTLLLLLIIYFVGGMIYFHTIDDDSDFGTQLELSPGESLTVAVTAGLIEREIDINNWVANDPIIFPSAWLDNMPNFQRGMFQALSRFAVELSDQIARVRGSSQIDSDLEAAAGALRYPGDVWVFDFSTFSLRERSESQYRLAATSLRSFNERLALGDAVFEKRADNLLATLDRFASDLGGSSAIVFRFVETRAGDILDFESDDVFYATKGQLYAYFILLRALRTDFADVIQERNLTSLWDELVNSMRRAALLHPWVVMNGSLDSMFRPNHLAAQGFLLLRARTQLREITNVLLK
ncbi:MAG: DUF2333 family protein [Pseudomonadota bacterium]